MAKFTKQKNTGNDSPYEDQVVKIYRCSTVVKGGRRFSFAGLVVIGNRKETIPVFCECVGKQIVLAVDWSPPKSRPSFFNLYGQSTNRNSRIG